MFGDLCEVFWVEFNLWMNWRPKPSSLSCRGFAFACTESTSTRLCSFQGSPAPPRCPASHLPSKHLWLVEACWALWRPPPAWKQARGGFYCYLLLLTLLDSALEASPLASLCLLCKMRLIPTFARLLCGLQVTTEVLCDWCTLRA